MHRRFRVLIFLTASLVFAAVSPAQDLNLLPPRISKLWELRKQHDRFDALELIDAQTRKTFLQWEESPILSFKVSGLEFTDDSHVHVTALVSVHFLLPGIGEMERVVREPWIWKDGQWFMSAVTPPNLFESDEVKVPAAVRVPPEFRISNKVIDIGRHAQGDFAEGKIPFSAVRGEIAVIRPLRSVEGLVIGQPRWNSATDGYLPYSWDTTLLSKNVNQSITLEAKATSDATATVDVQFRAQIDAKVGFKQTPEIIDSTQAGKVEVEIQNLMTKPLKILSLVSRNRAFTIDDNIKDTIEAGKSLRLTITYVAQTDPEPASIAFSFSETLGRSPITVVPLKVKLPEVNGAAAIMREVDRIISTTPKPVLPQR